MFLSPQFQKSEICQIQSLILPNNRVTKSNHNLIMKIINKLKNAPKLKYLIKRSVKIKKLYKENFIKLLKDQVGEVKENKLSGLNKMNNLKMIK